MCVEGLLLVQLVEKDSSLCRAPIHRFICALGYYLLQLLSTGAATEQRTPSLRKELLSVLFVPRGPCLCMSFSVCAETPSIIPFVLIGSYITTGTGAPIRTKKVLL